MSVQYNIDLSRYNTVELECFLDAGIISVSEYEKELTLRSIAGHTESTPVCS